MKSKKIKFSIIFTICLLLLSAPMLEIFAQRGGRGGGGRHGGGGHHGGGSPHHAHHHRHMPQPKRSSAQLSIPPSIRRS